MSVNESNEGAMSEVEEAAWRLESVMRRLGYERFDLDGRVDRSAIFHNEDDRFIVLVEAIRRLTDLILESDEHNSQ